MKTVPPTVTIRGLVKVWPERPPLEVEITGSPDDIDSLMHRLKDCVQQAGDHPLARDIVLHTVVKPTALIKRDKEEEPPVNPVQTLTNDEAGVRTGKPGRWSPEEIRQEIAK
ncbi:MAG TPA: hypothetical protein PLV88_01880 [Methanoregulaceae archaeon]|nr:hypothetical protein [Methanoregulaceae archaeon]HNI41184.1 hypothetical protein [Methanoregulaceae archaeon]